MGLRQPRFIKDNIYFSLERINNLNRNHSNNGSKVNSIKEPQKNTKECNCGYILTILNLQNNYYVCPKCGENYWHT